MAIWNECGVCVCVYVWYIRFWINACTHSHTIYYISLFFHICKWISIMFLTHTLIFFHFHFFPIFNWFYFFIIIIIIIIILSLFYSHFIHQTHASNLQKVVCRPIQRKISWKVCLDQYGPGRLKLQEKTR